MIRLTARGALVLTLVVFTVGVLLAKGLGQPAVTGVFFLAGGAAAAWWARKPDLLLVAVSPPTVLCIVVVLVSAVTGSGGLTVSVAEGAALILAGAAPWLFAGTALTLIIAAARGLGGQAWLVRQFPSRPGGPARPAGGARPAGATAARPRDGADGSAGPGGKEAGATRV